MQTTQRASERITEEVTAWPGVTAGLGERQEFGFRVGEHEIGHLHGDRVAHFGFPRDVGEALRAEGRVGPHPVNRHSPKLASRQLDTDDDVREAVALMRLNYDRAVAEGALGDAA